MTHAMTIQEKKNIRKNRKGFTLIELIVVIAILAILAAIAIPAFTGTQRRAQERVHNSNRQVLTSAARVYIAEVGAATAAGTYTSGSLGGFGAYIDVDGWPTNPISSGTGSGAYQVVIGTNGSVTVTPAAVGETTPTTST